MPIYMRLSAQAKAIENHRGHTRQENIKIYKNPRVYSFGDYPVKGLRHKYHGDPWLRMIFCMNMIFERFLVGI